MIKPLSVILSIVASSSVLAQQSPDISLGMALDQGLSAVAELDSQYRFTLGNDGGAFDYIFTRGQFDTQTPFTWYAGAGAWGEWEGKAFGARVPLGLNWNMSQGWRIYGQLHPELNLYRGPELQIGAAFGVIYSF
ncbi:hypothetical protein FCU94_08870 [Vibrio sp. JPW-9-11-11]|uniref:hypothetical protein n=1 Tax=Vibrio sp. JPW-9-11-11 TaxID=1416532 RepID=UPI00159350E4|nr:hypothetical protein [Vibrio sp. JPW-9-11-11]NVD07024.1 hypothetical protein [Vibrio sp. JPW-9-11-11]